MVRDLDYFTTQGNWSRTPIKLSHVCTQVWLPVKESIPVFDWALEIWTNNVAIAVLGAQPERAIIPKMTEYLSEAPSRHTAEQREHCQCQEPSAIPSETLPCQMSEVYCSHYQDSMNRFSFRRLKLGLRSRSCHMIWSLYMTVTAVSQRWP